MHAGVDPDFCHRLHCLLPAGCKLPRNAGRVAAIVCLPHLLVSAPCSSLQDICNLAAFDIPHAVPSVAMLAYLKVATLWH